MAQAAVKGEGPRRRQVTGNPAMHTVKIYKEKHGEHDDKVAEYCEDFEDGGKFGARIAKETSRAVFVEYPKERFDEIQAENEAVAVRRVTKPGRTGIRGEMQEGEYGFTAAEEKDPESLRNMLDDVSRIPTERFTPEELATVGAPLPDPALEGLSPDQ